MCLFCVRSLFCYVVLGVLSIFTIISLSKRELLALLFCCVRAVVWMSMYCVSSSCCCGLVCTFPGHTCTYTHVLSFYNIRSGVVRKFRVSLTLLVPSVLLDFALTLVRVSCFGPDVFDVL